MSSIFEKIISGEIPCHKVWENDTHLAFLDVNPRSEGHTLVIPKHPHNYIFDIEDAEYSALWLAAKEVAALLKQKLGCTRVCIGAWGFEVPHAHIHLFPVNEISEAAPPAPSESGKANIESIHAKITG